MSYLTEWKDEYVKEKVNEIMNKWMNEWMAGWFIDQTSIRYSNQLSKTSRSVSFWHTRTYRHIGTDIQYMHTHVHT